MTLGSDLALGKLAHIFLQMKLFFVELEIQVSSGTHNVPSNFLRCNRGMIGMAETA